MSKRKRSENVENGETSAAFKRPRPSTTLKDEDDDINLSQRPDFHHNPTMGGEGEVGIIERVSMKNFMCHASLDVPFSTQINFIIGRNGSGKSAVMTALVVGLGGKANVTSRGSSLKDFIKSGKSSAEVAVKLRNRGQDAYKPEEYGKSIIVERRISSEGTSAYKLKNAEGRIVSNKREELSHILDQFNIQVENPVSILNQDTSRNFLHSKSPQDKYRFFLKATQLEQMKADYVHANDSKDVAQEILEQKNQTLPTLEKEVLDWEQKFKALASLDQLKEKVDKLKNEMAWAHVLLREKEAEQSKKELAVEENRTPKYKQKVDTSKEHLDKCSKEQKEIDERLRSLESEGQGLNAQHGDAKKAKEDKKKIVKNIQFEKRKIYNEVSSLRKDKGQIEERIEEIKSTAQHDFDSERRIREQQIAALKEERQDLDAKRHTTEHQMQQHAMAVQKHKTDIYNINNDLTNLKANKEALQRKIRQLEGTRTNRMHKFGTKMPDILNRIDVAVRRKMFHRKPIGPIGAHITLKDPKWALAVECCLGGLMKAFCCHDMHDQRILETIVKQVLPDSRFTYITSQFVDKVHDISQNKAVSKYAGVLDILEFDNTVVKNCLIDQRSVENVVLIEDPTEARNVMNRKPPKGCREAFTPEGDQVYGAPTFRYYSADKGRKAEILSVNVEEQIRYSKAEVQEVDNRYQTVQQHMKEIQTEIAKNQNEEKACRTRLTKINTRLGNLDFEIRELSSKEDPAPIDVTTLEEEVERYNVQISDLEVKLAEIDERLTHAKQEQEETEQTFKEIDNRIKIITDNIDPIKAEQTEIENKIESARNGKKHYEQKLKDHMKLVEAKKAVCEQLLKVVEEDTAKAEQYCERVKTRRAPQNIECEINQVQKRIKTEEKLRGNREEIIKKYYETKETYKKIKQEVSQLTNFLKALDKVMKNRQTQFFEFRRMIALRSKYFFIVMLSNRNYNGKIHFDHAKESLSMNVQPTTANGEGSKDLKSLSGGERSFATVCFILALWDAMESPFRCLDEFDVFMDMVNRRIAMDMMLDVAKEQGGHQFIFLTPQDMSHLQTKANVRIFVMPTPERGQGTINFRPQNGNDEEEEDENGRN